MTTLVWSTPSHFASTSTREHYAAVAQELHDKLLAAGLIAAPDTGQMDFGALTGAIGNNQSLGFRIYQLNDGNELPLFLKIEFKTAGGEAATNAMYALDLSIGFATNGSGALISGSGISRVGCGTSWTSRVGGTPDQVSCVCVTEGFIGVQWKERYFNANVSTGPSSNAADAPALASFFVCRDTDDAGEPTSAGASLVTVGGDGKWSSFSGSAPRVRHLSASGFEHQTVNASFIVGADTTQTIGGAVPVYNIYTLTPSPQRLAQIGCALRKNMGDKDEMQLALKGTRHRTFLSLPGAWPGDVYTGANTRAGIVMLWE